MLAAATCLGFAASCTRPPLPPPTGAATPEPSPPQLFASLPLGSFWEPGHRLPDLKISAGPQAKIESPEPATEAAELAAEFEREPEATRRTEIVYQLAANGSSQARRILERIYRGAAAVEGRIEVIEALPFIDASHDPKPSLALLWDALDPLQPSELRAAAVDSLRECESPAALPIWRVFLHDPDSSLRETAGQMIQYLTPFAPDPGR